MSTVSPDCARSDEHLLEYAYGELSAEPRAELERHLPGCTRCQAELAALRSTRRAMAALAPEPAPEAGLASLLAYAEQQAKRQARPSRPRWLGWMLGAVPTAAAVVIIATVALRMRTAPLAGVAADQEEVPNAIPVAAAAPTAPAPKANAELGEANAESRGDRLSDEKHKAAMPAPAPKTIAASEAKEQKRDLAVAPPPAKPKVAERQREANFGAGFASGPASAAGGSVGDLAKASKRPARHAEVAAKKASEEYAADKDDVLAQAPAAPPAAARPGVPAEPTPVVTAMPMPSAQMPASGRAEALDELAQADALRRQGRHRAAAEAYRSIYAANPHGAKASEALFAAATEEQAAGELAAAASDFERYAREFAGRSDAPAALARAAEIRRSQDGEGAATTLEQDLLRRYPNSPEARGVLARTQRVESEKRARKAEAPALDAVEPAPAPQPAAAAPAESR